MTTTDILTTIDNVIGDATGDQLLLERIRARAARPGMAAYPNGGHSTLAGAIASERRALDDEVMGWRPRAYEAKRIGPALGYPSLKGKNLLAVPSGVNEYRPAGPPPSPEPAEVVASPASPVLCRCSLCIVLGDIAPGHEPVADDEFLADDEPARRQRSPLARLRRLLAGRGRS